MEQSKYNEMSGKLNSLIGSRSLDGKRIFLFGHCNATEELADLLISKELKPEGILDNNTSKHGLNYKGIPIISPADFASEGMGGAIVLIVTRFYEAMNRQLRNLGFEGQVCKLIDYNSYADYSLSEDSISRMSARMQHGREVLKKISTDHPGAFKVFCPYSSLGDVYYCMSFLPAFLKKRGKTKAVICVYSKSCADTASVFESYGIEILSHEDLDAAVQAVIYLRDDDSFIAHNDKPYVMNLTKALYVKKLSFETIYKCGVYGLPETEEPAVPDNWDDYPDIEDIPEGRSVILAPYAGSVTSLDPEIWKGIRDAYLEKGYEVFTNTAPGEKPLDGTRALSPCIREMKSVVERAGTFIGLRSGICDVIRSANCRKIAFYPDYNFSDTKWKSIDVFRLEEFENIVIKDGTEWKKIL